MKWRARIINFILGALAFVTFIGATASIYFQSSFLVVTSRSMEPTIKAGDTILVRPINSFAVKQKDVVVLPVPDAPGVRYAHRVIAVSQELNGVVMKTQGDANPNPDAWSIEVTDKKVPKVVAILPTSIFFALSHIFGNDT